MTQLPNQYNRSDSLKLVFEKRKTKRVFCITTNRLFKKNHFLYVLLCFIQSIVTSNDLTYREHWTWSINRLWHYFLTLQFKYIAQASDISIFCTLPYSKHQNLMNWSRYHIISQISFVIPGNISELFEPLFAVLRASQCTLLPRGFFFRKLRTAIMNHRHTRYVTQCPFEGAHPGTRSQALVPLLDPRCPPR